MKKILIRVGIGLVVGVLTLISLAMLVDPVVRRGVEKLAGDALKVPVTLDSATVKYAGSVRLEGLKISNPEGYQEPQACSFERFDAALDVGSIFGDVVEVEHVTVIKPDLTIEFVGFKSNWSTLMDNLSESRGKVKDDTPESAPDDSQKKFRIGKIRIEEATVRIRSDLLTQGATAYTLPVLELEDIGTADGAATMAEILALLMETLVSESMKSGGASLPSQLADSLQAEIRTAGEAFQDVLKKAPVETIKHTTDSLKKTGEEIKKEVEGIKGLFKKKED